MAELRFFIYCHRLLLFSVFVFYPMFRTIYLSFFLTDQNGDAAIWVGFENYGYLLESTAFINSMKATGLFVLYTVPIGIILALFFALLANEKLKGIGFFRTVYSSTMGISVAASSVIWLFMFNPSMGMFNRMLSLLNLPQIQWLLDPAMGTSICIHFDDLDEHRLFVPYFTRRITKY